MNTPTHSPVNGLFSRFNPISGMSRPGVAGKNPFSYRPVRKALATVALAVLGLSSSYAQSDERKHFIALKGGLTIPMGDYQETDGSKAGYAQMGSNFGLESAFLLTRNIGVGAGFGVFSNPLDAEELLSDINREITAAGFSGSSTLEAASSYRNTYVMVGPVFVIPFAKSAVDFRVAAGSVSTTRPEVTYQINDETGTLRSVEKEAKGSAFGYSFGIGSRIEFSPNWALRVTGDYIAAEPEITTSTTLSYAGENLIERGKEKLPIAAYSFSIGIAYQFVK